MAADVEITPCRVVGAVVNVIAGLTPPAPRVPAPLLIKLTAVFVLLRAKLPNVTVVPAVAATGFFLFGSLARRAGVLPTVAIGQALDGVGGEMRGLMMVRPVVISS